MNRGVNLNNSICNYLSDFGYVILTSLPYYSFFIIMYFVLKMLSPNGNIDERFYNTVNSEKENKILKILEYFLNYICRNAIVFCFVIIFSFAMFILFNVFNDSIANEYILSAEALRLQKYIIENLLPIVLAVIGSVAVFYSLNKHYYVFLSPKDIVQSLKVKEDIISVLIFYFLCILSTSIYYLGYYIVDNTEISELIKAPFFFVSIVSATTVLIWLLRLFYSIITFIFSNKTEDKLLDLLHYNIHDESSKKINISNKLDIQMGLEYLLSKHKNQLKICDAKICFISFLKEYNSFTKNIKQKNFRKTFFYAIIFNLFLEFYLSKNIEDVRFNLFSIVLIIILNISACVIIYKTKLRDIFIHTQMWSWGFLVKKDDEKYYSSTTKNNITNKNYDEYFKSLYNIVCLYKNVLSSDRKCSKYFLNEIIKHTYSNDCDYILYTICLFLYSRKYGKEKAQLQQLKGFILNNGIEWDLIETNITALIHDIYRYDSNEDVKNFIYSVKNSDKIIMIKNIRTK